MALIQPDEDVDELDVWICQTVYLTDIAELRGHSMFVGVNKCVLLVFSLSTTILHRWHVKEYEWNEYESKRELCSIPFV